MERKKSVICECLVQLSVVAELQEVARVLTSINNTLSGVQRGSENERRGERQRVHRQASGTNLSGSNSRVMTEENERRYELETQRGR